MADTLSPDGSTAAINTTLTALGLTPGVDVLPIDTSSLLRQAVILAANLIS